MATIPAKQLFISGSKSDLQNSLEGREIGLCTENNSIYFKNASEELVAVGISTAPNYDPTKNYTKDEFCSYLGELYYANQNITAESWNASHWTKTTVVDIIGNVESLLAAL